MQKDCWRDVRVSEVLSTMDTACIWEPRSGRGLWDARFKPGWMGCTGMFMVTWPYQPWAAQVTLRSVELEIPVPGGRTDCWQYIFNMPGAQLFAGQAISLPAAPADPGGIVPTVGSMFRRYADMLRMDHLSGEGIFMFMRRFSVFSWCMYRHSAGDRRFILSLEDLLEDSPVCSLFFNAIYWGWTGCTRFFKPMYWGRTGCMMLYSDREHCDADTAAAISKNVYRTLSAVFEGGMLSDTCACDSAYRLVLLFFLCCQMNSYIHCAYCEQGGSICSAVSEQWVGCGRFHFCSADMLYPPSVSNTELTRQERIWPFGKDTLLDCGISIADMLQSFDIPGMPAKFNASLVLTDILCALLTGETDKIIR